MKHEGIIDLILKDNPQLKRYATVKKFRKKVCLSNPPTGTQVAEIEAIADYHVTIFSHNARKWED